MTREEERLNAAKQRYGEETEYLIAKTQAFLVGAKWADSCPPKGTSLIKWQTGEPTEDDWYLVSLKSGYVNTDYFHQNFQGGWLEYGNHIDPIIAWCKLSDIEPYIE